MKEIESFSMPTAGDVLVAGPLLLDPNFARSLVFLHEVGDEGALGFILNRPLGKTLGDIVNEPGLPKFLEPLPLYFGGPVQSDQFMLVLFLREPGGHRIHCDLSPDADQISEALDEGTGWLRAYIGYSGWTPGQLETECLQKDWQCTPSDEIMVNQDHIHGLWDLYHRGDLRWQALRRHFPKSWGRN